MSWEVIHALCLAVFHFPVLRCMTIFLFKFLWLLHPLRSCSCLMYKEFILARLLSNTLEHPLNQAHCSCSPLGEKAQHLNLLAMFFTKLCPFCLEFEG